MTVTTVVVTSANRAPFDALDVRKDQYDLIAANDRWLDEALEFKESRTFGLIQGGAAVGMFTLTDTRTAPADMMAKYFQNGCTYLWRFMVDANAQGRGVGRAALGWIDHNAHLMGGKGVSLTTADRIPGNALDFYLRHGYAPTGKRVSDEIELIKWFEDVADA